MLSRILSRLSRRPRTPLNRPRPVRSATLALEALESREVLATLPYGGIVPGTVAGAGDSEEFTFSANAGDKFTLAMTSTATQGGFVAFANVFAPSGTNVDNFTATGQRYLTAAETGVYTVRVHDNDFAQSGTFTLGLEGIHPMSPNPTELQLGGIVGGTIDAPIDVKHFTFAGNKGDIITLALTSTAAPGGGGFVAFANVFAPSGTNVSDFTATGQRYLELDEDGTYLVQLHDNDYAQNGSFKIGLEGITLMSPGSQPLALGGIVGGTIDAPIDVKHFTFAGRQGDVISLALTSTAAEGGFDAFVNVFAPSGTNVDNFTATGQRYLTLAENGTYLVQVHDNDYAQQGSYTIGLEGINPISPLPGALARGGIIDGKIEAPLDVKQFTFAGKRGDVISLALTSTAAPGGGGFVAFANVYAPSGTNVDNFTATGQRYLTLGEDGTYMVQMHDNDYAQNGSFTLGLEGVNPISPNPSPLVYGGIVEGTIDAPIDVKQFTFTGHNGDIITLAMTSTAAPGGGGFVAFANVYAPSGTNIDNFTATGQRYLTLHEDGVFMVQLHDNDYGQKGSYTIGLEGITPFSPGSLPLVRRGFVQGTIDAPIDVKQYLFAGKPGDVITLSLTSTATQSGFSAVVNVFAPSGTNVDNFTATGPRQLNLTEDGIYLVQVHDNDYAQKGAFTIGLQTITSTVPAPRPLVRGGFVTDVIDVPIGIKHFTFTAKRGDVVALSLTSTATQVGFVALAKVYAPSGTNVSNFLAANALRYLTAAETGTYVVQVFDSDLAEQGSFKLGLEGIRPPSPGALTLARKKARSGAITQTNDVVQYLFSAKAGARVRITLTSRAIQSGFAASGQIFTAAGSRKLTFAAGARTFIVPATGTYLILIHDNNFTQTGTFTIRID